MGPPPQYLIERKLVRRFMKQYLPKSPLIPEHYFVGVFECWRKFGAGSPRCKEQEMQYDFVISVFKLGQRGVTKLPEEAQADGLRSDRHRLSKKTCIPFFGEG